MRITKKRNQQKRGTNSERMLPNVHVMHPEISRPILAEISHYRKEISGAEKEHKTLAHKLCLVTPVIGLPGRVPGQKDLCSLGSRDSTSIFDPWTPDRETPPHQTVTGQ